MITPETATPEHSRIIVISAGQLPSEQAEALLNEFGDQHCAALANLLATFVQAARMKQYNDASRLTSAPTPPPTSHT